MFIEEILPTDYDPSHSAKQADRMKAQQDRDRAARNITNTEDYFIKTFGPEVGPILARQFTSTFTK